MYICIVISYFRPNYLYDVFVLGELFARIIDSLAHSEFPRLKNGGGEEARVIEFYRKIVEVGIENRGILCLNRARGIFD